jgi:hypothetical protein
MHRNSIFRRVSPLSVISLILVLIDVLYPRLDLLLYLIAYLSEFLKSFFFAALRRNRVLEGPE